MTAEADYVRRAARGDELAFAALWREHRDPVYRFAAWMLGDRATAEDVAQETFLALIEHPGRFNPAAGTLRTFLLAVARNVSRNRLRKIRPEEDLDFEGAEDAEEPLDHLIASETTEALTAAIATLPAVQREALMLFEYEEMSLAEVAQVLQVDVNTVKQRLWRARQRLKRELSWMKT